MLFVDNEHITDPRLNLAIEEYLLRSLVSPEDILLFYINEPSIIIGRNQNTLEEINVDYVEAQGIHVVRRLSGGGAVYHDLGNLNFSFITRDRSENLINFKKFTAPVIRALNAIDVPAELSGRNDILVDGLKISGNASYLTKEGIVSHGTLLFNSDLSHLSDALRVKPGKIASKSIKSVRGRVGNISDYLKTPMDIEQFRSTLLSHIFAGQTPVPEYRLTNLDWHEIDLLSKERYQCWEWNYGHSPAFNVQKTQRFPNGEIDARINVQNGLISGIKFYGDFFGRANVAELEQRLIGIPYTRAGIRSALEQIEISHYFGGITQADVLGFLY